MKQYNEKNIPLARELRKSMTPWERKLWCDYLRYYPVRFQRQKAIGEHVDAVIQGSLPQSASLTAPSSEGAIAATPKIYALGFFDGVHLGHQALLSACRRMAQSENARPAAITFDRHPQSLYLSCPPPLINTTADRVGLLRRFGMEQVEILPVNENVMSTEWQDFLENMVKKGGAGFVCGEDFRFGHRGEGNCEKLQLFCKERALPCIIVPEQDLDGTRISSTRIRKALESGDIAEADRLLGHPHLLTGQVEQGRHIGRTIGVPTANLHLPQGVLCPAFGVYACRATVGGKTYAAVTNVGVCPTVGGTEVRVEPWLLDFDADLYGCELRLEFFAFLREERKFESLQALQAQIRADAAQAAALVK